MLRYVVQRLALLIATAFGVVTITFILSILRGSNAELMLGARPTAQQIERAREALGLNDPLVLRFVHFIEKLLNGDLGQSLVSGQSVASDIATGFQRLWKSSFLPFFFRSLSACRSGLLPPCAAGGQ